MSDPYAEMINTFYTLTGAPLTVLLAVSRAPAFGYTASLQWIRLVTGLTDKTVTRAAALLEAQKMLVRDGLAWVLGEKGRAVIALLAGTLPETQPEPPAAAAQATTPAPAPEMVAAPQTASAAVEPAADRNYFSRETGSSSSSSSSCSRSLTSDSRKESLLLPLLDSREPQNGKNSRISLFEQNLALLQHYGICEPQCTRLARMPTSNPEMIRYHCETTESTGQAIYRIQCNWRVQPAEVDPYLALYRRLEAERAEPEEPPPLPEAAEPAWEEAPPR